MVGLCIIKLKESVGEKYLRGLLARLCAMSSSLVSHYDGFIPVACWNDLLQ